MPSFDDMKKMYCNVGTIGQQLKIMSDEVMQETFDNDISTRQCYIYDYYHDDQPELEYGYNPALSRTKIPVKLKFIVKSYRSIAKDDPDYHIMFEPDVWNSMSCKPDWFVKNYERFGIQFPLGLYVDIPDDRGVYNKWLVMYYEAANQFPKFGILKCNYLFKWVENDGVYRHKRKVWGVNVSQNSYTSGVWSADKTTTFDDQDKFYLPWVNPITNELKHDMRLFISMLQKEPYVYKITKVNNTSPRGVITFTVKQDRFEPDHDYVCTNPDDPNYGDMYADLFAADTKVKEIKNIIHNKGYRIAIEAPNYNIKLGSSKVLSAKVYDAENNDVTNEYTGAKCVWVLNGVSEELIVVDDTYSLKEGNEFKYKFKFNGDESHVNNNIYVTCGMENMSAKVALDIVAL